MSISQDLFESARRLRRFAAETEIRTLRPSPRLKKAMRNEELSGLSFALKARTAAAAAVAVWLTAIVPAPRVFYFLAVVLIFYLLGLIPHLLRFNRFATTIKMVFIALDVALIVAVIVLPAPLSESASIWPVHTRFRFPDYLYLLVYLAGSALSYSPRNVIWTGACILFFWTLGFLNVLLREDTVGFGSMAKRGLTPGKPEDSLKMILDPYFLGAELFYNQLALTAIMTGLLAAVVWRARRTLVRQTQAEVARSNLARYLSPDVADAMLAKPDPELGAPASRQVSVLFADIVGFTALAERLPPERVMGLLRSFHARGAKAVFGRGGTLDKYLGDGFMATFGTLRDDPEAARCALACAFDLQQEIDRWNVKRALRGSAPVRLAIGLHHGPVVAGNVGAERRLEFTVIGDPVNVASRLERMTREFGAQIAVSRATIDAAGGLEACPHTLECKGWIALRGREEEIELFIWPPGSVRVEGPSGAIFD